jgi:hypothetical protein
MRNGLTDELYYPGDPNLGGELCFICALLQPHIVNCGLADVTCVSNHPYTAVCETPLFEGAPV